LRPIYKVVELLMKCRVIRGTHLEVFKRCWVRGIECLIYNIIKKL
jgi:hypothetical protein